MIIIYISILCTVLYFSKLPRLLIEAVRMDDRHGTRPPDFDYKPRTESLSIEQRKVEAITANILLYEGYKGDAFRRAKMMTYEEQTELIERFKNDLGL